MNKRVNLMVVGGSVLPSPMPTVWYLEPIGGYSNEALLTKLPIERVSPGVRCFDKVPRDFLYVLYSEIGHFEESRKTDDRLHFSVWYEDKTTGEVKLWKGDHAYTHPDKRRKLRGTLKNGLGQPAQFPRSDSWRRPVRS